MEGRQIILANWPNYKRIICTYNISINIPSHLEELNEFIRTPINTNWTSFKQTLPISLESFQLDSKLLHTPVMLRDFTDQYQENRITATKWDKSPTSKF